MSKEKFYKNANLILLLIMILGGLGIGIYYLSTKEYLRVFSSFSIFFTILLPLILRKTKFELTPQDKFIYLSFIFLAHFLGSILNLYKYIDWFDTFVHFLSGILTFYIAYFLLERTNNHNPKNKLINFLYLLGVVALIAVSWEIIEYIGDLLFNANYQHSIETGVGDTMCDMIVAMLGGLISYLFYHRAYKLK